MTPIAIIDVETTGISPAEGDRPTEVAIVLTENGVVVDRPMVAHNASFDRSYWQAELQRLGLPAQQPFACNWPRPPRPGRCRDDGRSAAPHVQTAPHAIRFGPR